jgi:hypothetical protein
VLIEGARRLLQTETLGQAELAELCEKLEPEPAV